MGNCNALVSIFIAFSSITFTWNNQRSIFGDHLKYVYNDITKTYKVRILNYTKRLHAMFELDRNLSHPRNKGEEYHNIDWTDRDETLQ